MLQYKNELWLLSDTILEAYIHELKVGYDTLIADHMRSSRDDFDFKRKELEEELCWAEHEFFGRKNHKSH